MSQPSSHLPGRDSSRAPFASRPDFGAVGSMLDGRYRIDHVLGEGGMGVVVRATDTRLDRTVAIKLLHSEYADQEDVLERFAREATVIAKLRSRYVVSVLDVSTDRNRPYLVLEHLEGESLEDRIFRDGPLPVGEAVRYARQVAEALEEAHAAGILHRDIKPANVFLTRQSNHEIIAQILDFGTARFYDAKRDGQLSKPTITKQYETFGSPAYMPPEQISSARNTDERSDVWALGTVLYEAITGRLAFEGEYPEVFVVISTREPPPLRSLRPEAPAELETIIERCLRKVKEDRYASMTEVKRALLSLEQEILPARSRPNHTVPSPPMSGALLGAPASEEGIGEFPTTPAPAPPLDQLPNDLLRPTPHLPFPVFADGGPREPTPASIGPRTQPGVPLFDDPETELEQPAGTERSNKRLAWIGVIAILAVLLVFTGIRITQGTNSPEEGRAASRVAATTPSTNIPPPDPMAAATLPAPMAAILPDPEATAANRSPAVVASASSPSVAVNKPTTKASVAAATASAPHAPTATSPGGAGATKPSPVLPNEPKTPAGDPLGRRK